MKLTTRYLLAVTALLAVCISFSELSSVCAFLELPSLIIGISAVVHLLTTVLSLNKWKKWLFGTIAPTAGYIAWYIYGVESGNQHPGSIGVYGLLAGGLFWFPVGFALVEFLMTAVNRVAMKDPQGKSVG